jgi:hypothetical protein
VKYSEFDIFRKIVTFMVRALVESYWVVFTMMW